MRQFAAKMQTGHQRTRGSGIVRLVIVASAASVHGQAGVAAATHAVLSGPAITRINSSRLDRVVATNSMSMTDKQQDCPKLKTLSIGSLLAEAIQRIHEEDSVSSLFEM